MNPVDWRGVARLIAVLTTCLVLASGCSLISSDDESGTEASLGGSGGTAGVGDEASDATATGSSDESGSAGSDEGLVSESGDGAAVGADGDVADAARASITQLEQSWAAARAGIVAEVESIGWGLDEETNVVAGPGGWEIDLDDCPSGWSDDAGVTEGTIVIAQTLPLSGNLEAYSGFGDGMSAYFDYVNESGGIGGATIDYRRSDDGYVTTKTIEAVEDFLAADDPPFAVSTMGSPNSLAVYGDLNDACIPQPFVMSGHPAWGDPTEHPWTVGSQLSFATEASLWGRWIEQNATGQPVKVAAIVIDNDFGQIYDDAFTAWVDDNGEVVSEFLAVAHEPDDVDLAEEMEEIVAFDPDVLIAMTAGEACLQTVLESSDAGLGTITRFLPSVCKDPIRYADPAGPAAEGVMVVGGGIKSTTDPQYADEPFVAFVNQLIVDAGLDPANGLIGTGAGFFAWAHVEALRLAAELPGGLRRSNLALAMRILEFEHPMTFDGVRFSTDGVFDAYAVEGSEISRYDSTVQSWVRDGRIIDLNGASPICRWGPEGCR